ncbi:hypothetical protein ANCDUO_14909 [Ancylostoma duodenale]|uniref:Uncharacterized protein n=1 Tax=Ancylostoma duodenale TaxID=51022 RepID=A0A0C2CYN9_9BILA|nr:hypothetical protein ANCDUO_14909 [Ancylostoma duodenale]
MFQVIAISVGSLLKTQMQSLFLNRTTIEDSQLSFIDEDEMVTASVPKLSNHEFSIFDLGTRLANFCSIFGPRPATWFLPVYSTPGDGVNYRYTVRCGKEVVSQAGTPRKRRFYEIC